MRVRLRCIDQVAVWIVFLFLVHYVAACPNIVSKKTCHARASRLVPTKKTAGRVFIHHTASGGCLTQASCCATIRNIQSHHIKLGWRDIGYNFLIGGDGAVYEGRGWGHVGAHTIRYNDDLGIALIGDYSKTSPTDKMIQAAKELIACSVKRRKLIANYRLYGHRQAYSTACPGDRLYALIKKWPKYTPGKL